MYIQYESMKEVQREPGRLQRKGFVEQMEIKSQQESLANAR